MATSAHSSAASYAGMNGNSFAPGYDNNFCSENHKDLPAFSITQHDLTERVQKVMREFAGNENAISKIERALECSTGTAKNYLEGKSTPQGIYDARALAVIPGYLALKMELAGLQQTLDPRHQAKMVAFARWVQMEADNIFGGRA